MHQYSLFLDPLSVKLVTPSIKFLAFSLQIYKFIFLRVLTFVISFAH